MDILNMLCSFSLPPLIRLRLVRACGWVLMAAAMGPASPPWPPHSPGRKGHPVT